QHPGRAGEGRHQTPEVQTHVDVTNELLRPLHPCDRASRIVPPVDVAGAVRNEHIVPVVDRVGRVGPVEDAVVHAVAAVADLLLPTAGGYIERGEVGGGEARGVVSTGRRVEARATALEEDHQLVRIWTRIDGDAGRRAVPALRVRKGNPSPLV